MTDIAQSNWRCVATCGSESVSDSIASIGCIPKVELGGDCDSDNQCYSLVCTSNKCVECRSNQNCNLAFDLYCNTLLSTCQSKKRLGEFCNNDSECSSTVCLSNRCYQCRSDSNCSPSTPYCVSYSCAPVRYFCYNKITSPQYP